MAQIGALGQAEVMRKKHSTQKTLTQAEMAELIVDGSVEVHECIKHGRSWDFTLTRSCGCTVTETCIADVVVQVPSFEEVVSHFEEDHLLALTVKPCRRYRLGKELLLDAA